MNVYIDADAFVRWEKGEFDLESWIEDRAEDIMYFPATVWQQLLYGAFAWEENRAQKRARRVELLALPVVSFNRRHAERAAQLTAELKRESIGFADFQIAATVLIEGGELLTFNTEQFARVPGLNLAKP